jgi:uncharacterized protein (TIGR00369 family)
VSAVIDAAANDLLLRSPFHRFLGLRLRRYGDGVAEILLPFREELVGDPDVPYLHGAVVGGLLDIVGDYAVASRLGHGVPTIDLRVDFLRVAGREDLVGEATVVKLGRALAVVDAEAHGADGRLLAVGRLLYAVR